MGGKPVEHPPRTPKNPGGIPDEREYQGEAPELKSTLFVKKVRAIYKLHTYTTLLAI